ncbi:hypothetical protein D3C74_262660 [compost metagenome]
MSDTQTILLDLYKDLHKNKNTILDRKIEGLMRESQRLFWEIDNNSEHTQLNPNSLNIASMARQYAELIEKRVHTSINVLESVQAVSHIHIMGGDRLLDDNTVNKTIVSALYQNSFVSEVYYYLDRDVYVYLITLHKDDPDVTLKIFETYWELKESITGINFEFKPVAVDLFKQDSLPSDAKLIGGK